MIADANPTATSRASSYPALARSRSPAPCTVSIAPGTYNGLGLAAAYELTANVTTGSIPTQQGNIGVECILRDAGGQVVGGDFDIPTNLPTLLPPGTKFKVSCDMSATAAAATGEVEAFAQTG